MFLINFIITPMLLLSLLLSLLLLLSLILLFLLLSLLLLILLVYITRSSQWQGLGVVPKLWLLDFNYCQNNKAQWKNMGAFLRLLYTITGYLLFSLIYLIYLLSVNRFLLATVNNNFFII